jgi:hypothetical protein
MDVYLGAVHIRFMFKLFDGHSIIPSGLGKTNRRLKRKRLARNRCSVLELEAIIGTTAVIHRLYCA